jgi:sec-independent protein translocase protein TatA
VNVANGLGWPHLLIIAAIIVLLFDSRRLPEMARSLGQSARILRAETKGLRADEAAGQDVPAVSGERQRGEIDQLRERLAAAELREKDAIARARAKAAE